MGKANDSEVAALVDIEPPAANALAWDDGRLASLAHAYYADADIFYLREEPVRPADNMHVGNYSVLRLDPETNEVLGAHIEGWEQFFLPPHPEFRKSWERVVKPHLRGERRASPDELAQFNLSLMRRIRDVLRESEKPAKARA